MQRLGRGNKLHPNLKVTTHDRHEYTSLQPFLKGMQQCILLGTKQSNCCKKDKYFCLRAYTNHNHCQCKVHTDFFHNLVLFQQDMCRNNHFHTAIDKVQCKVYILKHLHHILSKVFHKVNNRHSHQYSQQGSFLSICIRVSQEVSCLCNTECHKFQMSNLKTEPHIASKSRQSIGTSRSRTLFCTIAKVCI